MNKNKSFLARFFSHNITLLVLAFVLAFVAWFIINASSETETNVTIDNIPVTIELTDEAVEEGLKIFNGDSITASVEVSGNRVTVGSLTSGDILITANQSSSIISPGTYTLSLTAKKTGLKSNYNIVSSVTPPSITVFVDREKQQEFDIENKLSVQLDDSGHYANTSISQSTVTLTGPETQVNRISSVAVMDTITPDSKNRQTVQEKLVYLDENDKTLDLPLVVSDVETVEATIQVLPITTVNLTANVSNAPSDAPKVTVSPSSVKIAGPQETLDGITDSTVNVGTLDYSKLKNQNVSQKFDITLPNGCKVISGETSATAEVDLSSYDETTVTAKISGKIDSSVYTTEYATNNVELTIYGPSDLVSEISASDVTAIADFSGLLEDVKKSNAISLSVPLKITLGSDYSKCWVYGSYTVNVNVAMKE